VRLLAGVPVGSRPLFLKIPYFGPQAMEELAAYDPSIIVGVLGGSSGTSHDAFKLLADAQKHGARVALFGRKIKNAEDPLALLRCMRQVVNGELAPREAVKVYHDQLASQRIKPTRSIEDDLGLTDPVLRY
jgi:hypothetical protein